MTLAPLLLLAALPQDAPARDLEPPALERVDLARWRAHLRPNERDLRFAALDWAPTFLDGLRRAAGEQRPLLLWAMNGHPLGCT